MRKDLDFVYYVEELPSASADKTSYWNCEEKIVTAKSGADEAVIKKSGVDEVDGKE